MFKIIKTNKKRKALKISIKIWTEIVDSNLEAKGDLSASLLKEVNKYLFRCPLCELYHEEEGRNCPSCPLKSCTNESDSYYKWGHTYDSEKRLKASKDVLATLKSALKSCSIWRSR